jgi:phosphoribosylaminoimidazole-succinocarboxamide synthase
VGADVLKEAEAIALESFVRGSKVAEDRGIILADTKFEIGYIDGRLSLCDEIMTPDSSRYWDASGWTPGDEPPSYDKQILRNYLDTLDWPRTPPAPHVPEQVMTNVRNRYIEIYEKLTARTFADWPGVSS